MVLGADRQLQDVLLATPKFVDERDLPQGFGKAGKPDIRRQDRVNSRSAKEPTGHYPCCPLPTE